jgi:glycosyltransferase involved in cell wall biosynthesis
MALSRKLHAKLIFNVSDLWPESAEKLDLVTNKQLLSLAYNLEKKCYQKASLVTCQTEGIEKNIKQRFPKVTTYWLPNGVDLDYYNPINVQKGDFRAKNGFSDNQILFFYGGIVGYAQGLDVILYAAQRLVNQDEVQFIIQGAGPEKERLIQLKESLALKNVHFLEPVSKAEMPSVLKNVDAAIIPLKKLEIFEGAIPSKVFETLAMEIPILLAVDGEARRHFVDNAKAAYFIEPENVEDLINKIQLILADKSKSKEMGVNGRKYAFEYFNRNTIAEKFKEKLNTL